MTRALLLLAALLALAACDSVDPPPVDPPTDEPRPAIAPLTVFSDRATFGSLGEDVGDEPFGVGLYASGDISQRREAQGLFTTSASGLWLVGTQGGSFRANAVQYGSDFRGEGGYGNYSNDCGSGLTGLFALDADTTYTDTVAWPRSIGAPVDVDGEPRVYGDRMLWGSACTVNDPSYAPFSASLDGVRVNTAVYGYDEEPGIRYIRYEITNSGAPVSDLRIGYWADADLFGEANAFDHASGLSYIYSLRKVATGAYRTSKVSGFAFLTTPQDVPLYAHTIRRKGSRAGTLYEGFDERLSRPEDFGQALAGLSFAGSPMVDPTTGEATRFAFTGDPFAGTGWRDGFDRGDQYQDEDSRMLTSLAPLELGTGESVTFTLVWVTAEASSPGVSKFEVDGLLTGIRADPSRWTF